MDPHLSAPTCHPRPAPLSLPWAPFCTSFHLASPSSTSSSLFHSFYSPYPPVFYPSSFPFVHDTRYCPYLPWRGESIRGRKSIPTCGVYLFTKSTVISTSFPLSLLPRPSSPLFFSGIPPASINLRLESDSHTNHSRCNPIPPSVPPSLRHPSPVLVLFSRTRKRLLLFVSSKPRQPLPTTTKRNISTTKRSCAPAFGSANICHGRNSTHINSNVQRRFRNTTVVSSNFPIFPNFQPRSKQIDSFGTIRPTIITTLRIDPILSRRFSFWSLGSVTHQHQHSSFSRTRLCTEHQLHATLDLRFILRPSTIQQHHCPDQYGEETHYSVLTSTNLPFHQSRQNVHQVGPFRPCGCHCGTRYVFHQTLRCLYTQLTI